MSAGDRDEVLATVTFRTTGQGLAVDVDSPGMTDDAVAYAMTYAVRLLAERQRTDAFKAAS